MHAAEVPTKMLDHFSYRAFTKKAHYRIGFSLIKLFGSYSNFLDDLSSWSSDASWGECQKLDHFYLGLQLSSICKIAPFQLCSVVGLFCSRGLSISNGPLPYLVLIIRLTMLQFWVAEEFTV
jgi:hypothetical protein